MIMPMLAAITHTIDPVLFRWGGYTAWYYGAAYALGFLGIFLTARLRYRQIGMPRTWAIELAILFALGILLGGHLFEATVYEWPYYSAHPLAWIRYWRGGMASHGVLLGGVLGTLAFCRLRRIPFARVIDELAAPAAILLALGRLGNFINGEIYGPITSAPWGVIFPGDPDPRHPVTLYESLKNVVVFAILLGLRWRIQPGRGLLAAHFVFWYGGLRILTDIFRDYSVHFLGIGRGQWFNASMALLGLVLILWRRRATPPPPPQDSLAPASPPSSTPSGLPQPTDTEVPADNSPTTANAHAPAPIAAPAVIAAPRPVLHALKWAVFVALLLLSLSIPSAWTREIPEENQRYADDKTSALAPIKLGSLRSASFTEASTAEHRSRAVAPGLPQKRAAGIPENPDSP
jgi:phosphatidylglycerol:prolipoprotein diacylglycerol transferase